MSKGKNDHKIGVFNKHGSEKDDLEYSTSWNRAFHNLYTQVSWLDGFVKINELATNKIVKKLIKNFFEDDENNMIAKKLP